MAQTTKFSPQMAFLEIEQLDGRVSSSSEIQVDFVRDWKQAASRLDAGSYRTTFQHGHWLSAWYGAFRVVSPLIAIVSDAGTGRDIAIVPLIRRVQRGIRIVEFADLGLTDYNAPILGFASPNDATGMRTICRALLTALRELPEGVDVIRMQKMPANIDGQPNPFVSLGRIGSCSLNSNLVVTGDDFDTYRTSIKRMQLPRCWRVFNRHQGATFRIAPGADEALALLDTMDAQQHARMKQLGLNFVLNDHCRARFYRDLVRRGIVEGYAVVSALICGDETVATALGIRQGTNYSLLRTSYAGKRWSSCSPGLLVVERTMATLHQQGVRKFDLSIGNYDYKRRFGAMQFPLTDVTIALSWRGLPSLLRDLAARQLRRHPWLAAQVGCLLGKRPTRERS
jgi:CelD/BcsL family acetyltransferase involved in cellulose biosynthesis